MLTEYVKLYSEISSNSQIVAGVFTVAITATASFLGLGANSKDRHWLFFLIPFLILIPALWLITSQQESTVRIATYISACIESRVPGLNWETHLVELRTAGIRQKIWEFTAPDVFYSLSISSIFAVLGLACLMSALIRMVRTHRPAREYGLFGVLSVILIITLGSVIYETCNAMNPARIQKYIDEHSRICDPDTIKPGMNIYVHIDSTMNALLLEEDTDNDNKITVKDIKRRNGIRGNASFTIVETSGNRHLVQGVYKLSVLLQELALARQAGGSHAAIPTDRLFENPVSRVSRMIREVYWDGLTRRIDNDVENLRRVLPDGKFASSSELYLYIPENDTVASRHFPDVAVVAGKKMIVRKLPDPEKITPEMLREFTSKEKHGLLILGLAEDGLSGLTGVPYVVPGGRFNEMYGWDSYFIALGLIRDGYVDLAKGMVDNFIYEIDHYGKILNGNRTYYLDRSQPPFLTSMALAVYDGEGKPESSRDWLKTAIRAAITEYEHVWMSDSVKDAGTGLSRYSGLDIGRPPEVEAGHFNEVYEPFAKKKHMDIEGYEAAYASGLIEEPLLDKFHMHDRAMRESGHDKTYRWFGKEPRKSGVTCWFSCMDEISCAKFCADYIACRDRCADYLTLDLNCLLHKYEIDIARTIRDVFDDSLDMGDGRYFSSKYWYDKARQRRKNIRKYLKRADCEIFEDLNRKTGRLNDYATPVMLYPLWACDADDDSTKLVHPDSSDVLVRHVLNKLEQKGGLAASAEESLKSIKRRPDEARQWDYPFGWAPHQMIAWKALLNYGYKEDAYRLIYKWLYMITINARDYNGTVPEKYDVVKRSHDVFAEYGNVGTKFDYITREGFGWMNASYQVGLAYLPVEYRRKLEALVPPERLFKPVQ